MTVTNVVRYGLPSNPAQPFWCYSGGMASLTLKDIPRSLHEQLRERAARHRRSLSQEALACLEQVVAGERVDPDALLATVRRLRKRVGTITQKHLDTWIGQGRP